MNRRDERSRPTLQGPVQRQNLRTNLQPNSDTFTPSDLSSLRVELQQAGIDSWQAGELISSFLSGRGYGVSNSEARTAAGRIESLGCNIQCMQEELSRLALSM